jgi:DNA-binding transcriptional ArsR family regulator
VVHATPAGLTAPPRTDDPAVGSADAGWAALTDATRRRVVTLLARGPLRAGELAQALATTPPSLSRHLRVLRKSGLVEIVDDEDDARVRIYRLRPEGFGLLHAWLEEVGAFWTAQLESFRAHAEAPRPKRR